MESRNNDSLRAAVNGITQINIEMRLLIEIMKERAAKKELKSTIA